MVQEFSSVKKLYGLIGCPLIHSFSKDYFNQKFQSEGISAMYLNFEIEDINQLMEVISEYPTLSGLNVTAPYKEQVIPFLDGLDETAKRVGAVNVIRFIRGEKDNDFKLIGYNSDAIGFSLSLKPYMNSKRTSALVLGTGGASKAITYALESQGIKVDHVSRHKSANTITYEELTKATVQAHKIIVDTTPLGMYPKIDTCPDFPYRFLTSEHLCYDLVYNPDETLFMKNSKKYGAEVKNGLEMLLLQAFASYEIWENGHYEM